MTTESKEQKKCNDRWTVAEVLGVLSILALMGGFVQHLVKGTEDRVISAIEKTETKIERVENKLDDHILFHLNTKQCLGCVVDKEDKEETITTETIATQTITEKLIGRYFP